MTPYMQRRLGLKLGTVVNAPKEPKPLKKVSDKKAAEIKAEKKERGDDDTPLQKWYRERIKNNTGKCLGCGKKYNKKHEPAAFAAVAHVLSKSEFPSVAMHKENSIELSATCGCHNEYDNLLNWEERAQKDYWPLVLEKFLIMEPHIKERERIPEVLFQEIPPKI